MKLSETLVYIAESIKTASLDSRLGKLKQLFPTVKESTIKLWADVDPTPEKKYLTWLLRRAVKKDIDVHDDTKVERFLRRFQKLTRSPKFEGSKDINQYASFDELVDTVLHNESKVSNKQLRRDYAGKMDDKAIKKWEPADPTPEKKYIGWILKQVTTKRLVFPEDFSKTQSFLSRFNGLIKASGFSGSKDIDSYDTFSDLAETVLHNERLTSSNSSSSDTALKGIKPVARDKTLAIYKMTDPVTTTKMAVGTAWCVDHESSAQYYLSSGDLYLILKAGAPYVLIHKETKQAHDINDRGIPIETIKEIAPLVKKAKVFDLDDLTSFSYLQPLDDFDTLAFLSVKWPKTPLNLARFAEVMRSSLKKAPTPGAMSQDFPGWAKAEKIIAKDPEAAYIYARQVVKGKWPEGEEAIAQDPDVAMTYLRETGIKALTPKAEEILQSHPSLYKSYLKQVKR